jgi:hypothetical protein
MIGGSHPVTDTGTDKKVENLGGRKPTHLTSANIRISVLMPLA